MRKLIISIFLIFPLLTFSNDNFKSHFELVKDNGKIVAIKPTNSFKFSIIPYLEFIKKKIIKEQSYISDKGQYEYEIESLLESGMDKTGRGSENVNRTLNALKKLTELQVETIFQNPKFLSVMSQFESKVTASFFDLGLNTLARLDDSTFFYKRNRTLQIGKWGISLAKKKLATIPLLNTASYVIVEVVKMLERRRSYYQNMLLHYFERYSEDDLGMKKEEVDHAFSSIYESKISLLFKFESNQAQANWDRYGTGKFYQGWRTASNRLFVHRRIYSAMGERINFAFQAAEIDGEKVIVNLNNNASMFKGTPAVAYYYNSPKKVERKRTVLMLAKLGLSFLQIPGTIKSLTESYLNSQYEAHQITEGALLGFLENSTLYQVKEDIQAQNLNPYY